jgi:hypothetical protein
MGKVILSGGESQLRPVNVVAAIDGHPLTLQVPPELLERLESASPSWRPRRPH